MSKSASVTMQINLAPSDLPHAIHTLPHQLRQWGAHVDEVLLTLDLHQSKGRYAEGWAERLPGMRRLLENFCRQQAYARTIEVDYSPAIARRLAEKFFGGRPFPVKDSQGGPFYSYFFGLDAATHDYVLHMDSDMMYGGGSTTWIAEAVHLLSTRPDVVMCSPLPGPPTATGELRSQTLEPEASQWPGFRATETSTRVFFADMRRFCDRLAPIGITTASGKERLQAALAGNPPYPSAEGLMSWTMAARGLSRIDFLGSGAGMWSIHPPYRSELFYTRLPALIDEIEAGRVPEAQRGHHDVNDSMVDWTSVRQLSRPLWRRAVKHQRLFAQNVAGRLTSA